MGFRMGPTQLDETTETLRMANAALEDGVATIRLLQDRIKHLEQELDLALMKVDELKNYGGSI